MVFCVAAPTPQPHMALACTRSVVTQTIIASLVVQWAGVVQTPLVHEAHLYIQRAAANY